MQDRSTLLLRQVFLLTSTLSFQKVNSKTIRNTSPDWLVVEVAESSALAHPAASMIVFTKALGALAADVAAARVLCAPYLLILIPLFSKTFWSQRCSQAAWLS